MTLTLAGRNLDIDGLRPTVGHETTKLRASTAAAVACQAGTPGAVHQGQPLPRAHVVALRAQSGAGHESPHLRGQHGLAGNSGLPGRGHAELLMSSRTGCH